MDRNTVDIAWIAIDTIPDRHWPALLSLLDPGERERAARFHFDRDRHAYIAGHALVRTLLARHGGLPAADWRFETGSHGRPEIAPALLEAPGVPPLRFNLSHTHGMAAVAVTLENDIGLDVECLHRTGLTLALADRFFAPDEVAQLQGLGPEPLHDALYAFWTLKEAYIKAVGLGLSLPLDAFAFTLDPLSVAFTDRIADTPAGWLFRRLDPGPDHAMALALRHADPASVRVYARPEPLDPLPV